MFLLYIIPTSIDIFWRFWVNPNPIIVKVLPINHKSYQPSLNLFNSVKMGRLAEMQRKLLEVTTQTANVT